MNIDYATVNIELLKKVRDKIAESLTWDDPLEFGMEMWFGHGEERYRLCSSVDRCGTLACIAGFTVLVAKEERFPIDKYASIKSAARNLLGLSYQAAEYLFLGDWTSKLLKDITHEDAIAHLDSIIREARRD